MLRPKLFRVGLTLTSVAVALTPEPAPSSSYYERELGASGFFGQRARPHRRTALVGLGDWWRIGCEPRVRRAARLPGDEAPLVVAASARRWRWLVTGASVVAPGTASRIGERRRRDRRRERAHGEHHRTETPDPFHGGERRNSSLVFRIASSRFR
jgi:hypothetical protein